MEIQTYSSEANPTTEKEVQNAIMEEIHIQYSNHSEDTIDSIFAIFSLEQRPNNKFDLSQQTIKDGFECSPQLITNIIDFIDDTLDNFDVHNIMLVEDNSNILYYQTCPYVVYCIYHDNKINQDAYVILYPLSGKVKLYSNETTLSLDMIPTNLKLSIQSELPKNKSSSVTTEKANESLTKTPETPKSNVSNTLTEKISEFNKTLVDNVELIKIQKIKNTERDKYGIESPFILVCTYCTHDKKHFNMIVHPLTGSIKNTTDDSIHKCPMT